MPAAQQPSPADFNRRVIAEFRENTGKVGGPFEGAPLLLLTTTGAKTSRRHTTPTMYLRDGGRLLVFASNAGFDHHPAWFHNVSADPRVTVEIGAGDGGPEGGTGGVDRVETLDAIATVLHGEERDRLYARQAELVPAFADYQAKTERLIPVVALRRVGPGGTNGPDGSRARALSEELVHIHDGMRRELADLRTRIGASLPGPTTSEGGRSPVAGLDAELRARCLTFCAGLHEHHIREDDTAFPPLEQRFPALTPVIARLREEHTVVARINADLTALLEGDGGTDPVKLRARFDELSAELEDHFNYEEEQLSGSLDIAFPAVPPH